MQKAQTIGPARVGERYLEDLSPSLVGIARKVLGGAQRPASVAAEDPYGIGAWLKGAGPMPTPIAAEIQAWHASPHDFEKFLLSKIGTGEGAQAYGHGLYFAENPEVSGHGGDYHRQFTRTLQSQNPITYQGGQAVPGTLEHRMLSDIVNDGLDKTVQHWEHNIASNREYAPDQASLQQAVLDKVKRVDPQSIQVPKARSYEVSIKADPDQFLDWDKPLSQQSEAVKMLAKDAGFTPITEGPFKGRWKNDYGTVFEAPTGRDLHEELSRQARDVGVMAGRVNQTTLPGSQAKASEDLRGFGIPGIKYLDRGSRTGGPGFQKFLDAAGGDWQAAQKAARDAGMPAAMIPTRNYVVFDDKLIDILKKYAVAGAVGGSLASLGQQQTEEQK
jgi:hypothetical protein